MFVTTHNVKDVGVFTDFGRMGSFHGNQPVLCGSVYLDGQVGQKEKTLNHKNQ